MTADDWKAMSIASRCWFVLIMALAVMVGANALFSVAAPTLDPGKFSYETSSLEGHVSISSYKGLPVIVITDAGGRNHASRCNPYAREQSCIALALSRGLQPGQLVEVGLIKARLWPFADDVIVRLATKDHVLLGCVERLQALGINRQRISGAERISGC
ncbi:hypothetical protein [Brevundimonas sp.]|uniref:hypothetical protein n=1 Tax=Brevundimonas sp. TaxID=1871086 RepID=UPI0025BA82AB|nr:hypothetical protein [Brevundimonas sp.]